MLSLPRRCRNVRSASSGSTECAKNSCLSDLSLTQLLPLTPAAGQGVVMKRSHDEDSLSSSNMTSASTSPASKIPNRGSKVTPTKSSNMNLNLAKTKATNNNCSPVHCQVFLGGSCNPTTWRSDIAIPILRSLDITYFNPQVANWCPELMEAEHRAKDGATILFFVIDNQTRAVAAMVEVAYLVAQGKNVILVISGLKGSGQVIMGEAITQSELDDLTFGHLVLQELVEQHEIPVFKDIASALRSASKVVYEGVKAREDKTRQELGLPSQLRMENSAKTPHLIYTHLRRTFDTLATSSQLVPLKEIPSAYKCVTSHDLAKEELGRVLEDLKKQDSSSPSPLHAFAQLVTTCAEESGATSPPTSTMVDFDKFCSIMLGLMYYEKKTESSRSNDLGSISLRLNQLLDTLPCSKTRTGNGFNWSCTSGIQPGSPKRDVYLGGSFEENETWRTDLVIPMLQKHGLSSCNGERPENRNLFLPRDWTVIRSSTVLLFYIRKTSRALDSLVLAAYCIGLRKDVVLCVEMLNEDSRINGEPLTKLALKDYNRGRAYISDIAKREGISVFENLNDALDCVVHKCLGSVDNHRSGLDSSHSSLHSGPTLTLTTIHKQAAPS